MRGFKLGLAAPLVLGLLIACGGDDPPDPGDDPQPTPAADDDTPEPATPPPDWSRPDCGDEAAGDLDRTADHPGGKVRLCVRTSEVRLWGLTAGGQPDMGFAKGEVEVRFTPRGGTEQMVSGIILKGDGAQGWATRMLGHGGAGVDSATVVIGSTEVAL